jgi:hypothetical protein
MTHPSAPDEWSEPRRVAFTIGLDASCCAMERIPGRILVVLCAGPLLSTLITGA